MSGARDGDGMGRALHIIKTASSAVVLASAAALFGCKVGSFPARAEPPAPEVSKEEISEERTESAASPLSEFIGSHSEAAAALKSLLERKLEDGEDAEAMGILRKLVSAQPKETQWKFLLARLHNELGEVEEARKVFDEILAEDPLSFEALFEAVVLMDRSGDGDAAWEKLGEALGMAERVGKEKEARDVKFIMAQLRFLQRNVEEALRSYEELASEDPKDFRPYFCKGVIYSLLDRNQEAREEFARYKELAPGKHEVEGFLQTPLSRMKLFGTEAES